MQEQQPLVLKTILIFLIILNGVVFFKLQKNTTLNTRPDIAQQGVSQDNTTITSPQVPAPDFKALREKSVATERIEVKSCTDISPSIAQSNVGQKLVFSNRDDAAHTLFFAGPNDKKKDLNVDAGKEADLSLPDAGVYFYNCDSVPSAGTLFLDAR